MGKWETVRLGDVCFSASSNIAQKDMENNNGAYPIYGASGLIKYVDFFKQSNEYIAIVKDGAGIGRTTLLPAKSSVIGTMQYVIPKENVNARFLYYAISSMNLAKYYTGATIPHIYFKDYKVEKLICPPLPVQQKIADILDRANALIEKRKAQIEKLDLLVKARFVEMFGDPVTNPMGWEIVTLDKVCRGIGDGLHGTPQYEANGDYPFINGSNLVEGKIVVTSSTQHVSELEYKKYQIQLDNNTILISINGTLGKLALYRGEKLILGKSACYCRLNEEVNKLFIYAVMSSKSFQYYIRGEATASTINNISLKTMREYPLILPPRSLQNQFAAFVERVEMQKALMKRSLDKLGLEYKSLMQKCFRGEVF